MSTIIGEVSIPADDQGFVLMQCPLCGEFFKIELNGSENLRKLGDIFSSMSAFERLPFAALQT